MRITITTGPFLPLPPASCGAIEVLWLQLAEAFAARGHAVTFVSRAWPGMADGVVDGVRHVRRSGFRRSGRIRRDLVKDAAYSLRVLPALPPADILVTNVFWLPALAAAVRPGAGRVVVNVARMPKGQMRLYDRAARLACVSQAVRDEVVRQRPVAAARAVVVPNPIDTAAFVPPAESRPYDGTGPVVYTGRVHPEKGVHLLVEAFARLAPQRPGLRLQIVGPATVDRGGGGEPYLGRLRTLAAGLPVEFLPPVADRARLARVLQDARYYCYPSVADKGESFGVAPLEAMGTGLAPVVSGLACFRDFVEDGVNGLVFDHSGGGGGAAVAALTAALDRLTGDHALAAHMGARAAETATRFSIDRVADLYLDDFRSLLDGREAGAGEPAPSTSRAPGGAPSVP